MADGWLPQKAWEWFVNAGSNGLCSVGASQPFFDFKGFIVVEAVVHHGLWAFRSRMHLPRAVVPGRRRVVIRSRNCPPLRSRLNKSTNLRENRMTEKNGLQIELTADVVAAYVSNNRCRSVNCLN
jgi:hypothetical protein